MLSSRSMSAACYPPRSLRPTRASFVTSASRVRHVHSEPDESFSERAERVKHELSIVHSVVMTAHVHDQLKELREQAQRSDLWDDPTHAAQVLQQLGALESRETRVSDLRTRFLDAKAMYVLASEEDEQSLMDECMTQMTTLLDQVKTLRVELMLSSESDRSSCFIEIQAGAGGTESCDWVAMLARMYSRWADARSFKTQYADESPGEEAGFRSVCLRVDGAYAYGWAKTEAGVHRLVRISPFDSAGRRHTSFAQVRVYPMAAMAGGGQGKHAIEIPTKDLRIDTYRSSGAGGQHVNTTDSAVRITHLPTGIVVTCQSDRSQHRNKAEAMEMLQAKLYQRELEQQMQAKQQYTQGLGENAWGNQIRSYVLHPYKMVKDHRTNFSLTDTRAVLDGELDRFMEEMLLQQAGANDA
ncbi:hypothetical protein Poli38472_005119 [Pythium oligandrum]|uniref:Prokaryotic-type class I peptide chain release factors domain-containing protein n=1 Tax=Pythium oligandrum TaxID=41045 RepID=A0A8K1CGR1_PYTOL|nr:hypothetical protein Poli38472_005119 [Pythium oligandrum]|eukprot:TMW62501.1 hypothetical protein Poli38472_005119 [Pythium oligandrum]